jgi:glycopeptide antibiotics resistance protein
VARSRATLLLASVAALVLVVLLAPHHTDLPIAWLSGSHLLGNAANGGTPLWWALENVSNVALFLPLGLVLAVRIRPVRAWALATVVSACCETAQLWIPSRHASVLDVAMNSIGAALGVGIVMVHRRLARVRQASRTSPHSVQAQ